MDDIRRPHRGRSASMRKGTPLSVQTNYPTTGLIPLPTPQSADRQSPNPFTYPEYSGSPRDSLPTPMRSRGESFHMMSPGGMERMERAGGYVQSPRGPIPTTPVGVMRNRRPSFAQGDPIGGSMGERQRRGSLLQNEVPVEQLRRMSLINGGADLPGPPPGKRQSLAQGMSPIDGPSEPIRTRRPTMSQGDGERHRKLSFYQTQQLNLYQQQLREQQAAQLEAGYASGGYSPNGHEASLYRPDAGITRPSSAAATNSSNGEIILLTLVDLDAERDTIKMKMRAGATIQRVGDQLMDRFNVSTADGFITFYRGRIEMRKHESLQDECTLYYRIVEADTQGPLSVEDPVIKLEISRASASSGRIVETRRVLKRGIAQGWTVKEFREAVARTFDMDDADNVLVEARNGMHTGPLEGQEWRMCDVARGWLCSKFCVYDLAPGRAVKVRFLPTNRRYIFHTTPDEDEVIDENEDDGQPSFCDVKNLRERFINRVLHGTDAEPNAARIQLGSIQFFSPFSGKGVRMVKWGNLVDIEIDPETFQDLEDQEAWLLGPRSLCQICCEDHYDFEYHLPTTLCKHPTIMCDRCLNNYLVSQVDQALPEAIVCPELECGQTLSSPDVAAWAYPDLSARFDHLLTTSTLRNDPNFYWCAARCGSGQIHISHCTEMTCANCRFVQCILHPGPYHKGRSCRQVDLEGSYQTERQRLENNASKRLIRDVTRNCPNCASPVELREGCNHITCSCGAQWCYACLGRWERDRISGMWIGRHAPGCPEATERPFFDRDDQVPERFRRRMPMMEDLNAAVEDEEEVPYGSGDEYRYEDAYVRVRTPARSVAAETAYQYEFEDEEEERKPEGRRYWSGAGPGMGSGMGPSMGMGGGGSAAPRRAARERGVDSRPPRSEWQRLGVPGRVGRRNSLHRRGEM